MTDPQANPNWRLLRYNITSVNKADLKKVDQIVYGKLRENLVGVDFFVDEKHVERSYAMAERMPAAFVAYAKAWQQEKLFGTITRNGLAALAQPREDDSMDIRYTRSFHAAAEDIFICLGDEHAAATLKKIRDIEEETLKEVLEKSTSTGMDKV